MRILSAVADEFVCDILGWWWGSAVDRDGESGCSGGGGYDCGGDDGDDGGEGTSGYPPIRGFQRTFHRRLQSPTGHIGL